MTASAIRKLFLSVSNHLGTMTKSDALCQKHLLPLYLDKVRNDVFCSYLYYSRFPAKTQTFVRFFFHIFTPFSLVLVRIQGAQSRSAAAITTSLSGSMLQQGGIPRGRPVQELIPELNRRVVTIPIHKRRAHCVAARLSIPQRHGAARPAFASFFISNRQNQQKNIKDL